MPLNQEAPEETERRRRAALDDRNDREPEDRDEQRIGRAHPPRDVDVEDDDDAAAERIGHAHPPRDPDEEDTAVGYQASELVNRSREGDEVGDDDILEEIDLDDFVEPDDFDGR